MSAREELYAAVMDGGYHSPERSERASARIDAFRAEVLREAAEKIRTELPETVKESLGGGIWTITTVPTAKQAADLIDPEVKK